MSAPLSRQASVLRKKLFVRMALSLLVFTMAFFVFAVIADALVAPKIGDLVVKATSEQAVLTPEEYQEFVASQDSDFLYSWQVLVTPDGNYEVRNLDFYYTVRAMKIPLFVILFLFGFVVVLFVTLNRSIRFFDALSGAVGKQLADKKTAVDLPEDLSIVKAELDEIRLRSLADEQTAKRAEERKNELVAYLAHDIKTPLTSVLGYLSLLRDVRTLSDDQRVEYAEVAFDKAERLEVLIDEFFEITRYNLQRIEIHPERVDVALFCRQLADEFYPEAKERDLEIVVEAAKGRFFFVDPDKFARVLSNVVRNALAYAKEGTRISINAVSDDALTSISIMNQGEEIRSEHLNSVFEKFFREDASRTAGKGGAGLGLAIAKEIVIAHGGSISAESENGFTTFKICVPTNGESSPTTSFAAN